VKSSPVLTSVAEVTAAILTLPGAGREIVGIAGAPGAGKSTIAAKVVELLGPSAALLGMDGWHLPQARLVELGRRERMGAVDTFDTDGFVRTLDELRTSTGTVTAPGFDRTIEEAVPNAISIGPAVHTVVVEGNYLLHDGDGWERVAPLLDATFIIRVSPDIRRARLIARHERFGKTPDDAAAWALGPDEANARLIDLGAGRADYTIAL